MSSTFFKIEAFKPVLVHTFFSFWPAATFWPIFYWWARYMGDLPAGAPAWILELNMVDHIKCGLRNLHNSIFPYIFPSSSSTPSASTKLWCKFKDIKEDCCNISQNKNVQMVCIFICLVLYSLGSGEKSSFATGLWILLSMAPLPPKKRFHILRPKN